MPIYVYKCENGHLFELLQKMDDPPPEHCNECDAPVEKALTSAGLISKTSGFSADSITPEASAQFTRSAEGGRGGTRKEEVFMQKMPGFDVRAKERRKKKPKKKKGSS